MTSIWVTRPLPSGERSARALREAGFDAWGIPLLEIETRRLDPSNLGAVAPDLLVFASANAVSAFFENLSRWERAPELPLTAACIGGKTRDRLVDGHGYPEPLYVADHAAALIEYFNTGDEHFESVWIPCGNRPGSARGTLADYFRSRRSEVRLLEVYATTDRPLSTGEQARLGVLDPGAVILHSPSAAESLRDVTRHPALHPWWHAAQVAVGATTADRLRELGAPRVFSADRPTDESLIARLRTIFPLSRSES